MDGFYRVTHEITKRVNGKDKTLHVGNIVFIDMEYNCFLTTEVYHNRREPNERVYMKLTAQEVTDHFQTVYQFPILYRKGHSHCTVIDVIIARNSEEAFFIAKEKYPKEVVESTEFYTYHGNMYYGKILKTGTRCETCLRNDRFIIEYKPR